MHNDKKYKELLPDEVRKELLFRVGQEIDDNSFGPSASWTNLGLLRSIAQGLYYDQSNKISLAKAIKANNPELYSDISVFFHQNEPEEVEP
jgi:hypothetical protein